MASTLNILKSHNDRINNAQDGSFYALCSPRYGQKPRSCLKCTRSFLSDSAGHRLCASCRPDRNQKDYYARKGA